MNEELNLRERLNELNSIIHEEKLLFILFSLILPGGLIYLVFFKEFTESPSWFIFINFLLFLLIYVIFLRFKKGLKLKILGKIDYFFFDLNIDQDFEDFKIYISELSHQFKNRTISHKETKIKTFNKWIADSDKWTEDFLKRFADKLDSYERKYDKMISDLRTLKVEIRKARENIKNTTISYKNFILIIFGSFMISMFMYIFEFVRTMNGFWIAYVSFFIILLLIDYLKEVLSIIKLSFIILVYRLMLPISKRYLIWEIKKFGQESIK